MELVKCNVQILTFSWMCSAFQILDNVGIPLNLAKICVDQLCSL